jgi:hypothetical protein
VTGVKWFLRCALTAEPRTASERPAWKVGAMLPVRLFELLHRNTSLQDGISVRSAQDATLQDVARRSGSTRHARRPSESWRAVPGSLHPSGVTGGGDRQR